MKRALLAIVFAASSLYPMAKPSPQSALPQNIGVHTAKYQDEKRNRPVVVEVWYPTAQKEPFDYPEDPVWEHPKEIRDVPLAKGKYPVILMSHGHGGSARDRSWLVEPFIKNGFIVASVEHYGNSWRSYNPLLTIRFWERAKDISFAITELFKDATFKGHLDPKRIGFIGYSLGGMTGLALSGARAQNVKKVAIEYLRPFKEVDKVNLEMLEAADFSEAEENFSDHRIKAFALLSPAAFAFSTESFKKITAPVALIASEGDEILPHEQHALKVLEHLKPTKMKIFKDKVSHFVFLNRVSDVGKGLLRPDIQTEVIQADRLRVHDEVGKFLVAFFKEHLH
jgi:predicted dienelactone hydrolase